jgi:pimeloyl-ACP methyl ester carboxylesterase
MRPAVVMIHGMWAGGWTWEGWAPIFEEKGYHCLTPTLRHHDVPPHEPPKELGSTSLLDYAGDLERMIAGLSEPPVLMGHSMGGLLAQMLGARCQTRALVLLDPVPPRGFNMLYPANLRLFRSTVLSWNFCRKPTRPLFADAVASILGHLPGDEQKTVYERMVHESGRVAYETGLWFLDPHRANRVDASRITCPVLVVAGAEDPTLPAAKMRKLARRYEPHSTYWEMPGRGHLTVWEPGWRELAAGVADWLDVS